MKAFEGVWGGVGAMVYFPVCLLDGRIRIEVYNLALGGGVNERSRWCLGGGQSTDRLVLLVSVMHGAIRKG